MMNHSNQYISRVYLQSCVRAQSDYCESHRIPMFAPTNGVCWRCKNNIFNIITIIGAKSTHITRCPYCSMSFCE